MQNRLVFKLRFEWRFFLLFIEFCAERLIVMGLTSVAIETEPKGLYSPFNGHRP
jgi:hypothetical protein